MNSKKPFDPNKPFTTRDGRPARLLAEDLKGSCRTLAVATVGDHGYEVLGSRYPDGCWSLGGLSPYDLVNIPEETREFWNLYERTRLSYPNDPRGFETASLSSARHKTLEGAISNSRAAAVLEVVRVDGEVVDMIIHKREKK